MDLASAIDVFTQGFAAVRSRTHPFLVERIGTIWRLQDGPRRSSDHQRRREIIALWGDPAKIANLARSSSDGPHTLGIVHDGQGRREEVEEAYKALGYRYIIHEPFFVRTLPPAPRGRAPLPVKRVRSVDVARKVAKAARSRQIAEENLGNDEADWRLFAAMDGGVPVGWVSSIRTRPDAAWVSNLYVERSHRNLGLGASLMRTMLRDDLSRGIRYSVLLASQAGARLYRRLGYDQIGTLQMFTPRRDRVAGNRKAAKVQKASKGARRK